MSVIGALKTNEKGKIFTWVLSRDLPKVINMDTAKSPQFGVDRQTFSLEFHRNAAYNITHSFWRLILYCQNLNSSLICKYNISIIMDGGIIDARTDCCTITKNCREILILGKEHKEIQRWISSTNDFHIRCELSVSIKDEENLLIVQSAKRNKVPKLNFDWVFLDIKLSDVKLRTKCGKEIPAHRLMLATASPVFKAMFNHDMLENKSQLIDMIDVSYETAVEMMRYIYTGGIENDEISLNVDLMAAAEKYQLEELKNECEQLLGSNLSIENAFEMLTISDTYNADHLKKEAVDFIKLHLNGLSDFHVISNMILGKAQIAPK